MEMTEVQNKPVTVGDWIITMIIAAIPIVNIVMLFVWAFSAGTNPSKANWAKAYLVFIAIIIALYFVMFFTIGMNAPQPSY